MLVYIQISNEVMGYFLYILILKRFIVFDIYSILLEYIYRLFKRLFYRIRWELSNLRYIQ